MMSSTKFPVCPKCIQGLAGLGGDKSSRSLFLHVPSGGSSVSYFTLPLMKIVPLKMQLMMYEVESEVGGLYSERLFIIPPQLRRGTDWPFLLYYPR